MSETLYIKAAVLSAIKPIIENAFFVRSPAAYPKVLLRLHRLGNSSPVIRYMLWADFYGKIEDVDELDEKADRVMSVLSGTLYSGEQLYISAHSEQGGRDYVGDTAEDICHITANIPLKVVIKEKNT